MFYFEDDDDDDCSFILSLLFYFKQVGSLRVTVIFSTVMLENVKLIQRNEKLFTNQLFKR